MTVLINAYCTVRETPPLAGFPHTLNNRRDRSDPELAEHLNGFVGYVLSRGDGQMNATRYAMMSHLQRVRHHLSLNVEEDDLSVFSAWAEAANAILFLPDGTVRDPHGAILVDPTTGTAEETAQVPYPADARARKQATDARLAATGICVPATLPPVLGEAETEPRDAADVVRRAFSLFAVAVRAESLAAGDKPLPVPEIRERLPVAFEALSPKEAAFLDDPTPEQQAVINFAWQYECLALLQWALGLADDLPDPTTICDVPSAARRMLDTDPAALVQGARLRPTAELLDALDLHYRLHWAVRQAGLDNREPPAGLEGGVVFERHRALNWLTRADESDWDDVDTPT